jgi:hypothetical protein
MMGMRIFYCLVLGNYHHHNCAEVETDNEHFDGKTTK